MVTTSRVKRHRIQLMVLPETDAALRHMSEATGFSVSGYLGQIVDEMAPHFLEFARAMKIMKTQRLEGLDKLSGILGAAHVAVGQATLDLADITRQAKPSKLPSRYKRGRPPASQKAEPGKKSVSAKKGRA